MARLVRSPVAWILLIGVLAGLAIGNDFGASYDEQDNADVGEAALRAYSGSSDYFSLPALADHGPVYFMAFSAGSILPAALFPGWTFPDGRHLVNYLTFLAGVACFYFLCRRWMGRWPSSLATLLLATQPLLFGHAFINQKDIPFMTFFLASVTVGIVAADRRASRNTSPFATPPDAGSQVPTLGSAWRSLGTGTRAALVGAGVVCLALGGDLAFGSAIDRIGRSALAAAHAGHAPALLQAVFDLAAPGARAAELAPYLNKYEFYFAAFRFPAVALLIALWLALLAWKIPAWRARLDVAWSKGWILPLLLGALLLGCTLSIRQVGAFAGGLVALYWLTRVRRQALIPLAGYFIVAGLTMYVTWPYLWRDPWGGLLASFRLAGDFPSHKVLFDGQVISSRTLPWEYFPVLAGLQLTVPAGLLILTGAALAVRRAITTRALRADVTVVGLWILVPLVNLMFLGMSAYGTIRHLLFVVPPMFLLAALAVEELLKRLHRPALKALAACVLLLPGLAGIVRLHPYEYIYYNELIGGVGGAFGRFELDRWCTSYRQAAEALNQVAPPDASVLVYWPVQTATPYLRPDLHILTTTSLTQRADYVMVCTRQLGNDVQPEGYRRVIAVRQGEAVLAEVWQRP